MLWDLHCREIRPAFQRRLILKNLSRMEKLPRPSLAEFLYRHGRTVRARDPNLITLHPSQLVTLNSPKQSKLDSLKRVRRGDDAPGKIHSAEGRTTYLL